MLITFKKRLKRAIGVLDLFLERYLFQDADKTRGGRERVVVPIWNLAKSAGEFNSWAHIQRYEWVEPFVQGLNCLDAGCGSGYGTNYLAHNTSLQVVGVDLSADAIFFAQKHYTRANLTFNQTDALDLKFGDSTFDAVISFDVIEHMRESEQEQFIVELRRDACQKLEIP